VKTCTLPLLAGDSNGTLSFAGDDRFANSAAAVTVHAQAIVPTLTLRTDRSSYTAGQTAKIFVDLARSASRAVTV
jgi:hypothetical protein